MIRALAAALAVALVVALAGCGQKGALRLPGGQEPAVPPPAPAAPPSSP